MIGITIQPKLSQGPGNRTKHNLHGIDLLMDRWPSSSGRPRHKFGHKSIAERPVNAGHWISRRCGNMAGDLLEDRNGTLHNLDQNCTNILEKDINDKIMEVY